MRLKKSLLAVGIMSAAIASSSVFAKELGGDLTPIGAEKAGNADGSIPAWTGGLTTPPGRYNFAPCSRLQ